jgi:uncharacterized protein (DUF2252 family)
MEQFHHLKTAERAKLGKQLRKRCSRSAMSKWKPPHKRKDPIELLLDSNEGRIAELIPIRFSRMLASPFTFFRGAASIMAYDLSLTQSSGLQAQCCGDCHLLNFGGFATPERKITFDINDFDETSIAPWEWDIKRLAASFVIAGRANGFNAIDSNEAAWFAAQSYRNRMAEIAETPVLDAWYESMDFEQIIESFQDEKMLRFYRKKLSQAFEESSHEKEFAKLTYQSGDRFRIKDDPPLIYHEQDFQNDPEFRAAILGSVEQYKHTLDLYKHVLIDRYTVVDIATKVVGIGSVGAYCGILLLMSGGGDALFLQYKQARQSVLEPYAGASPYKHHGQRVVVGQKLMQSASDIFLGWLTAPTGRQFYMRQLKDAKIKPVTEIMKPSNLKQYAKLCGRAVARAHARSLDAVMLSSYLGKSEAFEDAIKTFAAAYADQNERDYDLLVEAVRSGRVEIKNEFQ